MGTVDLVALRGTNPLGLFAALGALDVATRLLPPAAAPTLAWTDGLEPHAVLTGPRDTGHLVALCDADRARWRDSPVLRPPEEPPPDDLKPDKDALTQWTVAVDAHIEAGGRAHADLFAALLSEGAMAGGGQESKPTHFHFTAGQQRFLAMARTLAAEVDTEALLEALRGPWRYESELPVLRWDARGERIYAHSGHAPTKTKLTGVPGADWLAFLGLRYFPVTTRDGGLRTTGCAASWKNGWFRWPLWNAPATSRAAASLLRRADLAALTRDERTAVGIHRYLEAKIRRAAQGGRGNFGAPVDLPPPPAATRAGRAPRPLAGPGRATRPR